MGSKAPKIQFENEYCESDERLVKIVKCMYQFNPHFRVPASRLLKSSFFDDIRDPELEKPAPKPVVVEVDAPEFFDYSSNKVINLSKNDLKHSVMRELSLVSAWLTIIIYN